MLDKRAFVVGGNVTYLLWGGRMALARPSVTLACNSTPLNHVIQVQISRYR